MKARERNEFIDILKGISIWFVVWGHVIQQGYAGADDFYENAVFRFIYGFHMPLFSIISGYLFYSTCQKRNLLQIFLKQLKSYGYPIIVWGLADWTINNILKVSRYSLYECVCTIYHSFIGLWFLWTILICSLLIAAAYYWFLYGGGGKYNYLLAYAFILFLWTPCKSENIWLFLYFLMGFLAKKYKFTIKIGTYIFAATYIPLLSFFHKDMYIYTSGIIPWKSSFGFWTQIRIDIYRWILGFSGICFVVILTKYAVKIPILQMIINGLKKIGLYTLQIYILQRFFLEKLGGRIYKTLFSDYISVITCNTVIYNYLATPLIAAVFISFIYVLTLLIQKSKKISKFLFAR